MRGSRQGMATIKDIANLAGVSHGTVSNVLNKKGNVSVEKINLVEKAAKELGFKLNAQAKQLRQGHTNKVCVIVPRINLKRYNEFFVGLSNTLRNNSYEIELFYSNNLPYYEEELLASIKSANPKAIVVISSILKNNGIFDDIEHLFFVERYIENMPRGAKYISFDYVLAGKELGKRCLGDGFKKIAILTGDKKFSSNRDFIKGVTEELGVNNCTYTIFSLEEAMGLNAAFEIITSTTAFDAVITVGEENINNFRTVQVYHPESAFPALYAVTSTDIIPISNVVQYELNYKLCGSKIAKYIEKVEEEEVSEALLNIKNDIFYEPENIAIGLNMVKEQTLNILTLASPTSESLRKLMQSFTLKTGIHIKLVEVGYDELYRSVKSRVDRVAYDLIRIDMSWLSEVGADLFTPIDLNEPWLQPILREFSPNIPDDYYRVGNKTYTLPFDPSVQILYYRKDLFENALIKREFYERYRRQLTVPKTFDEYNQVACFFTKRFNPSSPTEFGATMSFGTATVAACDFLPRLMEYKNKPHDHERIYDLNTEAVKSALGSYLDTYQYTDQSCGSWWTSAAQSFSKGSVAMNICYSNHASTMLRNFDSDVVGKIGFAAIPGGYPLLGGGVIGISKYSRKLDACKTFLGWIYNKKTAAIITYLGGYINNRHLVDHLDVLELYPWIEGMEKAFAIGWRRRLDHSGDGFNEFQFELILGSAVRSAVTGIMTVEDALREAQKSVDEMIGNK